MTSEPTREEVIRELIELMRLDGERIAELESEIERWKDITEANIPECVPVAINVRDQKIAELEAEVERMKTDLRVWRSLHREQTRGGTKALMNRIDELRV